MRNGSYGICSEGSFSTTKHQSEDGDFHVPLVHLGAIYSDLFRVNLLANQCPAVNSVHAL